MSTHAYIKIQESESSKPHLIIYVHYDGYPEGLGKHISRILNNKVEMREKNIDFIGQFSAYFLANLYMLSPDNYIGISLEADVSVAYEYVVYGRGWWDEEFCVKCTYCPGIEYEEVQFEGSLSEFGSFIENSSLFEDVNDDFMD